MSVNKCLVHYINKRIIADKVQVAAWCYEDAECNLVLFTRLRLIYGAAQCHFNYTVVNSKSELHKHLLRKYGCID